MPLTNVTPSTRLIGTTPETVLRSGSASQEAVVGYSAGSTVTCTVAVAVSVPSEAPIWST
ncbi:MAG: hypothetical protein ABSH46_07495 [Bryobacteraceae bacterium]